ncbi:HIPL2 protein [Capsicum baccatum]|uniref:HIPL2 protein n=1 Tax=Capsicum baccatum TaxID=33114 RepID=A0A2G2VDZ0_CAPBA|nr:HIPL2 protein [Capsicum baccatum]
MAISEKQEWIILRLIDTWKTHQELSILKAEEQTELSEKRKELILQKEKEWSKSSYYIFKNPDKFCFEEEVEKKKEEQVYEICERPQKNLVYVKDGDEFKKKTDKEIHELPREREEDLSSSHEIFKRLKEQTEKAGPDWGSVPFYEKRTEQRETAAPEWEGVYSYEEKRWKTLVDGDAEWEKRHHLWEMQNGLVPIYEEVFTPVERELEEKRKRKKEILLALELRSQEEDQKTQEEAFYERLRELHIKPLTEEEKKLKQSYLDDLEKVRLGKMKIEHFFPFGPGWDLAYYDIPDGKFPSPLPTSPSHRIATSVPRASLTPKFWKQLYEYVRQPSASVTQTTGSSTPVSSNLATEKRCRKNHYATPYCKCDPNCREYYEAFEEEHPPEIAQISDAYARQCRQTHCFDIDDYFDGTIHPLQPFKEMDGGEAELIMELANRAIQEYNEKESNIEKVNRSIALYDTYWMTVIVTNLTLVTPTETFQIHAAFTSFNDDSKVYCCGPKEEVFYWDDSVQNTLDDGFWEKLNHNMLYPECVSYHTNEHEELNNLKLLQDIKIVLASQFGMMGIAFHPKFSQNGRFFASFNCDKQSWAGYAGRCSCNSEVDYDPSKLPNDSGTRPCQFQTVIAKFTANGTASQSSEAKTASPKEVRRIFTMSLLFTGHHGGHKISISIIVCQRACTVKSKVK